MNDLMESTALLLLLLRAPPRSNRVDGPVERRHARVTAGARSGAGALRAEAFEHHERAVVALARGAIEEVALALARGVAHSERHAEGRRRARPDVVAREE